MAYRKLMARENEKRDEVGLERDEFKPLAFAARTGKWGETMIITNTITAKIRWIVAAAKLSTSRYKGRPCGRSAWLL